MTARAQDPRSLRSRTALEMALRELIAQRPLARISVSDVTKSAGVNRSTFYEHYADVADLAASACTAVFDELVATTPLSGPDLPEVGPAGSRLTPLFAHVEEHAPLYRALLGDDGSARVHHHLLRRFTVAVHISRVSLEVAKDDARYDPASAFIAGALLGAIVDWLEHDRPVTPEVLGAVLWPQLTAATETVTVLEA